MQSASQPPAPGAKGSRYVPPGERSWVLEPRKSDGIEKHMCIHGHGYGYRHRHGVYPSLQPLDMLLIGSLGVREPT